jgi:hypothetical protein
MAVHSDVHVASQLLVLDFKLADALLLGGQGLTDFGLPKLLGIELRKPASDGRLAQLRPGRLRRC